MFQSVFQSPARYQCLLLSVAACVALLVSACDEQKKTEKPTVPSVQPPEQFTTPEKEPVTMPQVSVYPRGVSLGIEEMPFSTPSFDVSFRNMLKRFPVSQPEIVVVNIDRAVKTPVVTKIFYMLVDEGAKRIEVRTKSRGTFDDKLVIGSEKELGDKVAECTYVSMVLSDLGVTFWKKSGGLAKRYTKGMAGPDFSAMHEVMHKEATACNSTIFLFSAAANIDWGHAFDTAGSVKAADPPYEHINQWVLLRQEPVPGKPVRIGTSK